ncbi:discoidin domain-containing protein, partial [Flavonifractor sp. An306]|uniref:discoidin domain-containing protein n=1 Tax=Flavonifractor sp. An306 TaxID=1965629 RepID=UPI000B5502AF
NEVYNTHNDGGWNGDGQAWDADWGDGTVYQYNYSHDNEGGCFMICLQHAYNSVFRYNISQNDSAGVIVAATSPRANIYNNTFYIKENVPFVYTNSGSYGTLDVKNNIIYYAGSTPKNENWQTGSCSYANNIFVNYNNVPTGENNIQMTAVEGASLMVDPGKGGTGNAQGNALNTLDGYKLQDGSRAINAGTMVSTPAFLFEMESQGVHADQDFFGNPIGLKPDIGAFESELANEGDELLLVSNVYQIVEEDTGNSVNGIPKNTTVEQFLEKVQYTSTATAQVTRQDTPVEQTQIILSGDILTLSAADKKKQYTLYLEPEYYERTGWTATAGSAQSGEGAEKALDGNVDTLWHSNWNGCTQDQAWISIDMKQSQTVSALQYVPRQAQINGLILEYKIEFSTDGTDWSAIPSVTGTWAQDNTTKTVTFSPVQAQYVRLTGTKTASDGTQTFISAAEIYLGRIVSQ